MKTSYLLAAALALAMVPGRAAAVDAAAPIVTQNDNEFQGDATIGGEADVDEGVGGTGDTCPCPEGDVGGTGELQQDQELDQDSVGGTGVYGEEQQPEDFGGTGTDVEQPPSYAAPQQNVVIIEDEAGEKREASNKGYGIRANGGVEGYTGDLAPNVEPGGAWGVTVTAQPHKIVGFELGYAGAVNNLDDARAPDGRITRNGGNAALRFALSPTKVEPFVFGGIGFSRANVTGAPVLSGYEDDTFGQIPVGAGVDLHLGAFTAGIRGTYQMLFDRDFAPNSDTGVGLTGEQPNIWNGLAQIGAQF